MGTSIIPIPRCPVSVRVATLSDLAFIDSLQKMHSKALGFMRRAALEGKIAAGQVLVAWAPRPCASTEKDCTGEAPVPREEPLGYVISQDRYFKRDDLGIVYQLNVLPGKQRSLIGAMLIKTVFEHAAYGCRLFCCWCAQDLDANYFWESMGFIPLAFRTGAVGKKTRTHIFWQRRIREGDATTAYWYPSKTDGGMMREDRIVLPIPPGVHWKDAMPVLLPESGLGILPEPKKQGSGETPKPRKAPTLMPPTRRRVQFGAPSDAPEPVVEKVKLGKPAKPKRPARAREKVKADPVHIAKARELRDRYLEHFNGEQFNSGLVLPEGKYAVGRCLGEGVVPVEPKRLPAAA